MSSPAWVRAAARLEETRKPKESLCNGISGEYAKGLHVGAIFVVLFASLIGTILPLVTLYIPFLRRNPFIFVVAKTAATGVLLSVSTIHLLGDGIAAFEEPCIPAKFYDAYPAYHLLFAIVAALVMHYVDYKMLAIGESWMRRKQNKAAENDAIAAMDADAAATSSQSQQQQQAVPSQEHSTSFSREDSGEPAEGMGNVVLDCEVDTEAAYSPAEREARHGDTAQGGRKAKEQKMEVACGRAEDGDGAPSSREDAAHDCAAHHDHAHGGENGEMPGCGCVHSVAPPEEMGQLRRVIAAICMEFGITLHSLFVGLDTGLKTDRSLKPLLIALVFHQLFEGMSMGARLVDAKFHVALDFVLAFVFSFSAPIGMSAATIAVFVKPDAMSGGGFVLMMAVLDSVCAGILLYLAFSLLFIDFTTEMKNFCSPGMPGREMKKNAMFISLWFGMLLMALIGKWC